MSYAVLSAVLFGVLIAGPGERTCSTAYVDFVQRVSESSLSIYPRRASRRCIAPDCASTMPATADICRTRKEC